MGERRIVVDGSGVADTVPAYHYPGRYLRHEELEFLMVADSQGEISAAAVVELDVEDFPNGAVICSEKEELWIMDAMDPGAEDRALSFRWSYFMDHVGRIMEISTGRYVTDRRDTFGFNTHILACYETAQADQANRLH